MNCKNFYKQHNCPCNEKKCRYWIEYQEDLNCTLITVDKHGDLTLREIAKRLKISFVRVQQIQQKALKKLAKRMKFQNIL
tara:strand:+ start:3480 stop:3719 length:240 start_codon:yes stop_codon:yes gene_type:complete